MAEDSIPVSLFKGWQDSSTVVGNPEVIHLAE